MTDQTNLPYVPRQTPSQQLLRFFNYQHLPAELQPVSRNLSDVAHTMEQMLLDGPEKTAGLRKLLEAKDCFVRAALPAAPVDFEIPKSDKLAEFDGEK